MFARTSGILRTALAVLALAGQLTPAVALPAATLANLQPGACAGAACSCSVIEKVVSGCCCSRPNPAPPVPAKPKEAPSCCAAPKPAKPKICCAGDAKPAPAEPAEACKLAHAPRPNGHTATLDTGGKCRCDKPTVAVTAEPAVPPVHVAPLTLDVTSQPDSSRWVALAATDPLPPPAPPPRA